MLSRNTVTAGNGLSWMYFNAARTYKSSKLSSRFLILVRQITKIRVIQLTSTNWIAQLTFIQYRIPLERLILDEKRFNSSQQWICFGNLIVERVENLYFKFILFAAFQKKRDPVASPRRVQGRPEINVKKVRPFEEFFLK